MKDYRVCAVVVTFNRRDLLIECLESLKKQSYPLNGIYVVDNASSDGTEKLLFEKEYIEEIPPTNHSETWSKCYIIKNSVNGENIKLHYVRLSENSGGAGGFYEGVKRAYEEGYDWLWLMDDDSEPLEDALEKLSEYLDEEDVSALAGVVTNPDNEILPHRGYADFNSFRNYFTVKEVDPDIIKNNEKLIIDDASFVGILVNRKSIAKIGFPKKELFIYRDDTEYCIRLRSVGRIIFITDSVILHKENRFSNKLLGRKINQIKYENYWLFYFEIRNHIWLLNKYRRPLLYLWIMIIVSWLIRIADILLYDDHKLKRINLVTQAYNAGLKGNFDNEKPKKILYG
jgi:rhamnopyranosyl-N-acetylglucosaminyl-diphospho-decaprenol beta-1,3/1,4-galactofuranosyltransferase